MDRRRGNHDLLLRLLSLQKRHDVLGHHHRLGPTGSRGLMGARVSHIPKREDVRVGTVREL
jgi:hypothetical protein